MTGLAEVLARLAAVQVALPAALGAAAFEATDELITVPSKDLVPVASGVARDSLRTEGPVVAPGTVTVYATGGLDTDGSGTHAPSNQYIVRIHEDLALAHPRGGGAKFTELAAMAAAPRLPEAIAEKMRRG